MLVRPWQTGYLNGRHYLRCYVSYDLLIYLPFKWDCLLHHIHLPCKSRIKLQNVIYRNFMKLLNSFFDAVRVFQIKKWFFHQLSLLFLSNQHIVGFRPLSQWHVTVGACISQLLEVAGECVKAILFLRSFSWGQSNKWCSVYLFGWSYRE